MFGEYNKAIVPELGTYFIVPRIGTMRKTLHSEEYDRLINWLRVQRESQGLTMRDLAEKLGIAHSFVGKVEQKERRLDVIEYIQYCKALEVSPIEGLKVIDSKL